MSEVYRIAHQGDAAGQTIMNISWWKKLNTTDLPLSNADLQSILAQVSAKYVAQFVPLLNGNYTYRRSALVEVDGYEILDPIPPSTTPRKRLTASRSFLDLTGSGTAGTSATDTLPNTLAAPVHWETGRYGRRRRGRWKVGPWDEGDVAGQSLTGAAATALSTAAAAYTSSIVVGSPAKEIDMIVFSATDLFDTDAPGDPWSHGAFVIDYTVQTVLGIQRSRKLREGTT